MHRATQVEVEPAPGLQRTVHLPGFGRLTHAPRLANAPNRSIGNDYCKTVDYCLLFQVRPPYHKSDNVGENSWMMFQSFPGSLLNASGQFPIR